MIRSADQVREEFKRKGMSITRWAIDNSYSPQLVFDILAGKRNPTRGQTHNIAVALGMKEGEITQQRQAA